MSPLLTLTHWFWWLTSPTYRRHYRSLRSKKDRPAVVPMFADTTMETLVGGQVVFGVHATTHCQGRTCSIHNPSDHHMAAWPQNWRPRSKIMERICPDGIGHPDPDHIGFVRSRVGPVGENTSGVHGCDGCCVPPEVDCGR